MSTSDVEIVECTTPQQRDEFIFFQWVPYQGNPYWCPPLISERREFYNTAKHPFHQHADVALFLAKRGGQTVRGSCLPLETSHTPAVGEYSPPLIPK